MPLGDPDKVEGVAKQVGTGDLTCRQLRRVVAEQWEKARKGHRRVRATAPSILKKIDRSARAFGLDGSKRWFSKTNVEELDSNQKKAALESDEVLIEKLKALVIKLRKAWWKTDRVSATSLSQPDSIRNGLFPASLRYCRRYLNSSGGCT